MLLLLLEHSRAVRSSTLYQILSLKRCLEVVSIETFSSHSIAWSLLHFVLPLLERVVSSSAVLVVLMPLVRIIALILIFVLCVFKQQSDVGAAMFFLLC